MVRSGDAEALAALLTDNRQFLKPWTPVRDESYFTVHGQSALITEALEDHRDGTGFPCVIADQSERLIGQVMLTDIHRGPVQSCTVGYWVSLESNGRGVARRALET